MTTRYRWRLYEAAVERADELAAALWEAGTLGVEELPSAAGSQRLHAFFAGPRADALVELPLGARLVEEGWVDEQDWLASYRALAQPIAVGDRLFLDPREPGEFPPEIPDAPEVPDGRLLLRVPARSAFGTGSHASTRLALRLLERQDLSGHSVLDVGTGSGVLALAALALGAARAVGFDLDPAAGLLAGQHARLNRLPATFWTGGSDGLAPAARFDVVVVNALPHEVLPESARIANAVAAHGRLLISGVLATEGTATLAAWETHGLSPVARLDEEEWSAWTLARG